MDTNQNNEVLENLDINEESQTAVEVETQSATPSEPIKEEQPVSETTELSAEDNRVEAPEETPADGVMAVEETNEEEVSTDTAETQTEDSSGADALDNYVKAEKKGLKIAILAILLALDIAALVIYLIGIDKVLSFIK